MMEMIEMINQTSAVDLAFERVYKKAKEWEDAEKRGDDPDKIKAMDFSAGATVSLLRLMHGPWALERWRLLTVLSMLRVL